MGEAQSAKVLTFRAHLGKGCAPSKKSPGFSKMRTFEFACASSNGVRTFEPGPQGTALDRCRCSVTARSDLLRPVDRSEEGCCQSTSSLVRRSHVVDPNNVKECPTKT